MSKRTFQPKQTKRIRKLGFMARMKSDDGRAIISKRRREGRKKLATA